MASTLEYQSVICQVYFRAAAKSISLLRDLLRGFISSLGVEIKRGSKVTSQTYVGASSNLSVISSVELLRDQGRTHSDPVHNFHKILSTSQGQSQVSK